MRAPRVSTMLSPLRTVLGSFVAVSALLAFAACSSDDADSGESVGGTAVCDADSVLAAANDSAPEGFSYEGIDAFECADGWAALGATEIDAADPDAGIGVTLVFEAEGQFWIPKNVLDVCGTREGGSERPDDALVPESIYDLACNTN